MKKELTIIAKLRISKKPYKHPRAGLTICGWRPSIFFFSKFRGAVKEEPSTKEDLERNRGPNPLFMVQFTCDKNHTQGVLCTKAGKNSSISFGFCPGLIFDRFMEGINVSKALTGIPGHCTGKIRDNPVDTYQK